MKQSLPNLPPLSALPKSGATPPPVKSKSKGKSTSKVNLPSTLPSISSSTLPPISSSTLPPISSSTLPSISSSTLPPISSSTLPPISSSTLPPISSSTLPPISSSTLPSKKDEPVQITSQSPIMLTKEEIKKETRQEMKFSEKSSENLIDERKKRLQQKEEQEKREEERWRQNLKQYLRYDLLPKIIPNESALDKLVSDEAMKVWQSAFTHESFNPNAEENYEILEKIGDSILKTTFLEFILQKFPYLNQAELSHAVTVYLAKPFQANLSSQLGMGKFVRTNYRISMHTNEDVIESFSGALGQLGNTLFKFGAGYGLVYNFVVFLYDNIELDLESATKENPKTQVKNIYEKLGIINPKEKEKVPEEAIQLESGYTTFRIFIPVNGLQILRSLGIPFNSSVVAEATAYTKNAASIQAYQEAIKNLTQAGLTTQFMETYTRKRDYMNPDLSPFISKILPRLKEEGFTDFYFVEEHIKGKSKQDTGKFVQLIGIKPDGYKKILALTRDPVEVVLTAKQDLLTRYANYEE
jgi:dsRNA-specific ribonuclease